ncbi:hypothetical protein [Amycolatopsis decaplanina]|nr:hypothetical protein [Amycolatopsis decaplanina]
MHKSGISIGIGDLRKAVLVDFNYDIEPLTGHVWQRWICRC